MIGPVTRSEMREYKPYCYVHGGDADKVISLSPDYNTIFVGGHLDICDRCLWSALGQFADKNDEQ
ncbi:MAG: hypothetical protein AB7Q01_08470 [Gammaproteobacteria bacterium]